MGTIRDYFARIANADQAEENDQEKKKKKKRKGDTIPPDRRKKPPTPPPPPKPRKKGDAIPAGSYDKAARKQYEDMLKEADEY